MRYAGFWRQLFATVIDQLAILIPSWFIPEAYYYAAVASGSTSDIARFNANILFLSLLAGFFVFYYVFLNGRYGVTLGRRLLNLKLVRLDQPNRDGIGYGKAAGRLFLFAIGSGFVRVSAFAGVPVALGVVVDAAAGAAIFWLLLDERRRTLLDMIAGTFLVHDPLGKFPDFDPDKLPPAKTRPYAMGFLTLLNAFASIFVGINR
jgi:uncharacterized RDD family membrane protein YckC